MPLNDEIGLGGELEASELVDLPSPSDLAILKAIGGDDDAQHFSFQGIRRKLGLHQETLSRALRRLQRDGFIEKLEHSYSVSQKGQSTISTGKIFDAPDGQRDTYSVVLLQSVLPSELNPQQLVESMSYKWFGNLRWLGSSSRSGTTTLSWITSESGLTISIKIKDETLTIETYPRTSSSISEATKCAFELFDHLSRALRSSDRMNIQQKPTAS